jgi:hypothetical protein
MAIFPGTAITPSAGGVYTYPIDQSLRFEDGSSAYLNRTPASAGNRKTWTVSFWYKRGNVNVNQLLFGQGTNGSNNRDIIFLQAGGTLEVASYGGAYVFRYITNQLFRDPSAWYHLVISVDTTDATSTDRVKIYLNGSRITSFSTSTAPSLNADSAHFNSTSPQYFGKYIDQNADYLDGYLAEVNFIDGQALTPDDFGETDATYGIWKPKAYSGTYGTNGFYLDFSNSADVGEDQSGNSNDFTANNLAATDVMLDTPTNNFATLNSVAALGAFYEGNLKHTAGASTFYNAPSTIQVSSKKWYAEFYFNSASYETRVQFGVALSQHSLTAQPGTDNYSWGLYFNYTNSNVHKYHDNVDTTLTDTSNLTSGDVVMIALDLDNNKLWFGKNGVWFDSGDPAAGSNEIFSIDSGEYAFIPTTYNDGTVTANFGQDSSFAGNKTAQGNTDSNGYGDFYYTPPTGFLALCTANLPEPTVVPSEHFNTVLYTGTGNGTSATNQAITGVGFQPDLLWIKARNVNYNHRLFNSVVGRAGHLKSNTTDAEQTSSADRDLLSFDSDGFTVSGINQYAYINNSGSGETYVAWNWKADNTSGSTNTDGSITSTVAANPDAGFSIVSYTGNGTSGATVGHGLNSAPEVVISKNRVDVGMWNVIAPSIMGVGYWMPLNDTYAKSFYSSDWTTTSSVVSLSDGGGHNGSGDAMIAYCFHSVDGFSKFGSYTGNGSADGPFVYTGFRPAFVVIKLSSTSQSWIMHDGKRSPYNLTEASLYADLSNAEDTSNDIDLLSNGFKFRSNYANPSGYTGIYMAFAEYPFKYSTAR